MNLTVNCLGGIQSKQTLMNLLLRDVVIDAEDGEEFFGIKNSEKADDKSEQAQNLKEDFHCKLYSKPGAFQGDCPLKIIKFYLSQISPNAYGNPKSKFLQKVV